jgi:hypothetical protein
MNAPHVDAASSLPALRAAVPEEHRTVFEAELAEVMLPDLGQWAMRWMHAVNGGNLPPRPYHWPR